MRVLYPGTGVGSLCQLLGKSRQAFYQGRKMKSAVLAFEAVIAELVVETREKVGNPKLGARKLLPLLNEQLEKEDLQLGRDRLFSILDSYGLKVRQRKRRTPRTTDSLHRFKRYPNRVKEMEVKQAEQVWVSDITYVKVRGAFMYLSLVTDAYSRKLMGYCLHEDLSVEGPIHALRMALGHRIYPHRKLIHHSDQGVQYCAHHYIHLLKTHGITISMSSKGSPHENALAERVNGILKQEYGLGKPLASPEKARQQVEEAVASYNEKRPHLGLKGRTPQQVHHQDEAMDILKTPLARQGPGVSNIPTPSSEQPVSTLARINHDTDKVSPDDRRHRVSKSRINATTVKSIQDIQKESKPNTGPP